MEEPFPFSQICEALMTHQLRPQHNLPLNSRRIPSQTLVLMLQKPAYPPLPFWTPSLGILHLPHHHHPLSVTVDAENATSCARLPACGGPGGGHASSFLCG
jgi:hypothetical protein